MKFILSRKGFDGSNGGIPSPIMPDGTLLSIPIPSYDPNTYDELMYDDFTYKKILRDLGYKGMNSCHVDPDIRENVRIQEVKHWKPAFGQIDAAQGYLRNTAVEIGDIFLFFGRFRRIKFDNGIYQYDKKSKTDFYQGNILHVIFGYMQVGEILHSSEQIQKYYWHPHARKERIENPNNALYLPSKNLSLLPEMKGYGVLNYSKKRVLTKYESTTADWQGKAFLLPQQIIGSQRKNSSKTGGLYYQGIWQELVFDASEDAVIWIKDIIQKGE